MVTRVKRGYTRILILGFLFACFVPVVSAHAELVNARPEPGAQLADAPAEVRLTFNEPVAAQSSILVLGEGFEPVPGLVPQLNANRPEEVYTPLPPLEPGTYTVQWSAVSQDGHEISGSYSFSVGEGNGSAFSIRRAFSGRGLIRWLLGLAAVALVLPFVIFWYRRNRRASA